MINNFPSVTVITPSVGAESLERAVFSVQCQDYKGPINHLIVTDGYPLDSNREITLMRLNDNLSIVDLPFNTGKVNGVSFYGHRIYAAFPQLINTNYVCFLDEDNFYEVDHISSLIETHKMGDFHFTYSLRQVFDKDGNFLCLDDCESLGKWPIWCSPPDNLQYLIDTSSYCFDTKFLQSTSHLWNHGWGGDRRYLALVVQHIQGLQYQCTGRYTLDYCLDGNPNSVTKEFFEQGNRLMVERYSRKPFPWRINYE